MAVAPSMLRQYQWGSESTAGTAVAATSKIGVVEMTFEDDDEVERPPIVRGLLVRTPGVAQPVRRGTRWTARGPVLFEEIHKWMGMVILKDAAPVGTAAPYAWTHTFDPTTTNALDYRTIERRLTDGTNHDDDEWAYATGQSITISATPGQDLVQFECSGFARRRQNSTLTAAQTLPTVDPQPSALTKVWIDSTWANVGTTQVTSQVLSWSFTFNNGRVPVFTSDARTDLDFTSAVVNSGNVSIDASITMLVDTNSGQYSVEQTAAEAGTLRAVRLEVAGSGNADMTIDFLAKHRKGTIFTVGEQDGLAVVTIDLQEDTDATNLLSVTVNNDAATLT